MSSLPPSQPDTSGPPGPDPQSSPPATPHGAWGQMPTSGTPGGQSIPPGQSVPSNQSISPDQPTFTSQGSIPNQHHGQVQAPAHGVPMAYPVAAPVKPEIALWPAALPKEPAGLGTVGRALAALAIFCLPLATLTAIGRDAGTLSEDFQPNIPITISGATHEITFALPWACSLDLTDRANNTLTCTQDDREVQVNVRTADSLDDLEVSAKRGAREATMNRFALDFPSQIKDVQGGKAAYVPGGTGLLGMSADSLAVSPDADQSGFVINITEAMLLDDAETVTPEFTEHLLQSITFAKIEDEEASA